MEHDKDVEEFIHDSYYIDLEDFRKVYGNEVVAELIEKIENDVWENDSNQIEQILNDFIEENGDSGIRRRKSFLRRFGI
jgi:uncharacterized protein YdaL